MMSDANDNLRTVWWDAGLCLIDQTLLPGAVEVVRCSTVAAAVAAISRGSRDRGGAGAALRGRLGRRHEAILRRGHRPDPA